ncbi:Octicosapeptide/Phox/Bem1p family protein [Heracleum sosnowskyi]|uniref:Octicosapeptide/Phox/Bem1p family protein n=1 Tax=Heracleum sosnowskyi TaxID=360622 RepID=A0AAD8MKY4_9APIA|nr:Octicosapeptide/Phox/Bem1p family protein [Heracleum sosnowskyi]
MVTPSVKFLCSYGGKILPRYPDGILRYTGGHTRVLSVDPSISFSELLVRMGELCGTSVSLRCQLPMEDLDALVSITCDEDLSNLMEEYDQAECSSMKIRAFLSLHKTASPTPSNHDSTSPKSPSNMPNGCCNSRVSPVFSAKHNTPRPNGYSSCYNKTAARVPCYANVNPGRIQNGNHWTLP